LPILDRPAAGRARRWPRPRGPGRSPHRQPRPHGWLSAAASPCWPGAAAPRTVGGNPDPPRHPAYPGAGRARARVWLLPASLDRGWRRSVSVWPGFRPKVTGRSSVSFPCQIEQPHERPELLAGPLAVDARPDRPRVLSLEGPARRATPEKRDTPLPP